MIWLLLLSPRFYRACAHDAREAIATAWLGRRCLVTGERVYARDRTAHEYNEHNGEGPCA